MDSTQKLIRESNKYLMNTYRRFPVVVQTGNGCVVRDVDGKEYIDFISGLGVLGLGHCPSSVVKAIKEQTGKLLHISNLFHSLPQIELAKMLVEYSFPGKVFFCNSGAEANEAAIKLARKYSKDKFGFERFEIICMENSFHGRTLATLAATGQEKFRKGFEPLPQGFRHVPFNDIVSLERAIGSQTCAIMLEPIQGEGGVIPADLDYMRSVREICNKNNILLILDEVQVGLGRTGRLFAYQNYDIKPDILSLGKALGGGLPLGAIIAREDIAEVFTPGSHGSTFGGNPVSCAAGVAYMRSLIKEGVLDHCATISEYFLDTLLRLKSKYRFIRSVRGMGLILAMELDFEADMVVEMAMEEGVLINCTQERVLRFLPPLTINRDDIDFLYEVLDGIFNRIEGKGYR